MFQQYKGDILWLWIKIYVTGTETLRWNHSHVVRCDVLTPRFTVFWNVMSCSLVDSYPAAFTFYPEDGSSRFVQNIVNYQNTQQHISEDSSMCQLTFRRNISPPSSGFEKISWARNQCGKHLSHWFLAQWTTWRYIPEDGTLYCSWVCIMWIWAVLVTFWRYMLPPSSG
jgi:hypothetical protein